MKNENAYKGNDPIEKTDKNAIIDTETLRHRAHSLSPLLSPEQLREMINHYHKGA